MHLQPRLIRAAAGAVAALTFLPLYLYVTELAPQWVPWLFFWTAYLTIPFVAKWSYEVRGFSMLFASTLCAFATPFVTPLLAKDSALTQTLMQQFSNLYLLVGGGVGGNFIAHGVLERERNSKGSVRK